jgi:hypothetical protein
MLLWLTPRVWSSRMKGAAVYRCGEAWGGTCLTNELLWGLSPFSASEETERTKGSKTVDLGASWPQACRRLLTLAAWNKNSQVMWRQTTSHNPTSSKVSR